MPAHRLPQVSTVLAVLITWGFAIYCLGDKDNAPGYFSSGKSWVTQNFTWLYIGARV